MDCVCLHMSSFFTERNGTNCLLNVAFKSMCACYNEGSKSKSVSKRLAALPRTWTSSKIQLNLIKNNPSTSREQILTYPSFNWHTLVSRRTHYCNQRVTSRVRKVKVLKIANTFNVPCCSSIFSRNWISKFMKPNWFLLSEVRASNKMSSARYVHAFYICTVDRRQKFPA